MGGEGEPGLDGGEVNCKGVYGASHLLFVSSSTSLVQPRLRKCKPEAETTGRQRGGDRAEEQQIAAGQIDTFPPGSRIKNSPQLITCQETNLPWKHLYLGASPCCQVGEEKPKRTSIAFGNVFWRKELHKQTVPGWCVTGWRWRGRSRR